MVFKMEQVEMNNNSIRCESFSYSKDKKLNQSYSNAFCYELNR